MIFFFTVFRQLLDCKNGILVSVMKLFFCHDLKRVHADVQTQLMRLLVLKWLGIRFAVIECVCMTPAQR